MKKRISGLGNMTNTKANRIRRYAARGWSITELANTFEVSTTIIIKIIDRKMFTGR
jgi:predicted DNA-binding protein YlxM (UPF0122 family)